MAEWVDNGGEAYPLSGQAAEAGRGSPAAPDWLAIFRILLLRASALADPLDLSTCLQHRLTPSSHFAGLVGSKIDLEPADEIPADL